ncbi:MAG: uracil-DNA glycosylase [[Lactobacillus] timonensis]|jgi:DNA polymerase|uniref:uracil-DNA glycosylase n=1 Tax=[Lactobacillus] timonensis TaxID=1970790 RepID=UPI000C85FAAC|nr:uracil-DNA glycosylase [[Lactobacillus] timonensis]MCI1925861.1 uracil-DNA glycosylase [[Lactobacillus] timonensis]MCI1957222.1 uracil-DNA glycosylase [[Lactobacillus] timonensis]MCI1970140.1 uracil-DNA glycosylase [[Lactobacillus] timonensis]MCI2006340.1 uracil-DNA glycosylase [[Lactobacillus] timonensis]
MLIDYPPKPVAQIKQQLSGHRLEGFVPGGGPKRPFIALVGEAPGRQEVKEGQPFVGSSGQELTKMMKLAGLNRDDVYITSVVRSRPFAVRKVKDKRTGQLVEKHPNRTPTKKEVLAYAPLFDWEIQTVKPYVIVALGNTSLQRLLGSHLTVGEYHGKLLRSPIQEISVDHRGYQKSTQQYWVLPMYHPAAYLYARRLEPVVKGDWRHFGQWLKQQTRD